LNLTDTYKTISEPSTEALFKDRNSKFFGYAFPVTTTESVKEILATLKKNHHTARHWCYAYQIGTEQITYRANDDGEPNNSAGMPIYGQIQSFDVTNVLIVVVRYFGGVKLGVGGLINAYKTAAQMALDDAKIIEKTINKEFSLSFEYKDMNKVMRIIKEQQIQIIHQQLELSCNLTISVRKKDAEKIFSLFEAVFGVSIK